MRKMMIAAILFLSVFSADCLRAQEILPVNAATVLQLAGANNLTVKEYDLRYKQALADQIKAGEWWLPTLRAGVSAHYLNGAAMNTDGRIFTGLNQNNLWASLGFSAEIDFNKGRYEYLASKQIAEANRYESAAQRNQVILQALQTYFDMQAAQESYLLLDALAKQADLLAQQLKIQVDAGLRYQSEYLLARSSQQHYMFQALQSKIDQAKLSVQLISLLNLGQNKQLMSADTVFMPIKLQEEPQSQTDSVWKSRPEYQSLQSALLGYQTLRKISATGFALPRLSIGTDDGLFGKIANPVYNTYQLNTSLVWSLPLGRLFKHGELLRQDARIALQENSLAQFQNQFIREMADAQQQISLTQNQLQASANAAAMAQEALTQSRQRQQLGTAKAFEVIQAQQVYLQIKLDQVNIITAYNKAQYAYKVALGEIL